MQMLQARCTFVYRLMFNVSVKVNSESILKLRRCGEVGDASVAKTTHGNNESI